MTEGPYFMTSKIGLLEEGIFWKKNMLLDISKHHLDFSQRQSDSRH